MEKEKIIIQNNSNNGDIIVQIFESMKKETANYWIEKGDICLKNLNHERALENYREAIAQKCSDKELYYCYNKMVDLAPSYIEKKVYIENIWNIKNIKKTKLDFARYIVIRLGAFIERDPKTFIYISILISAFIFGKFVEI